MSQLPAVGEKVQIVSKDLSRVEGWPKGQVSVFEGRVVPTFPWLEGPWICITARRGKPGAFRTWMDSGNRPKQLLENNINQLTFSYQSLTYAQWCSNQPRCGCGIPR